MKSLVLLVGISVLAWAALLYPGWHWLGGAALVQSAVAWVLCVVPGAAATAWALGRNQTAETRTLAVLAGSGIRMFATLAGGLILTELWPEAFPKVFWLWVGVFYLLLLALEVIVLVRHHQSSTSIG